MGTSGTEQAPQKGTQQAGSPRWVAQSNTLCVPESLHETCLGAGAMTENHYHSLMLYSLEGKFQWFSFILKVPRALGFGKAWKLLGCFSSFCYFPQDNEQSASFKGKCGLLSLGPGIYPGVWETESLTVLGSCRRVSLKAIQVS